LTTGCIAADMTCTVQWYSPGCTSMHPPI